MNMLKQNMHCLYILLRHNVILYVTTKHFFKAARCLRLETTMSYGTTVLHCMQLEDVMGPVWLDGAWMVRKKR